MEHAVGQCSPCTLSDRSATTARRPLRPTNDLRVWTIRADSERNARRGRCAHACNRGLPDDDATLAVGRSEPRSAGAESGGDDPSDRQTPERSYGVGLTQSNANPAVPRRFVRKVDALFSQAMYRPLIRIGIG
jgi:hypothetical protein